MNLATWTSARVGKQEYKLGQVDCFKIVMEFISNATGKVLPNEHRGMTLDTYGDWYLQDESNTFEIAVEYLNTHLNEIPVFKSVAGDILVLRYGTNRFFGIDGGNGKVITVFLDRGVRVVNKKHFETIKVFSCQQ